MLGEISAPSWCRNEFAKKLQQLVGEIEAQISIIWPKMEQISKNNHSGVPFAAETAVARMYELWYNISGAGVKKLLRNDFYRRLIHAGSKKKTNL